MPYPWPNKTIREFTDVELADALQAVERGEEMNQSIVRSCWREWERRHGLPVSN